MTRVTEIEVLDVRFPTSRERDGSDAMNPDPDYSVAYVILRTDAIDGPVGHGFSFTIGRGTEIVATAIRSLERHIVGRSVESIEEDPGQFWRELVGDSQLRWIGPEKGAIHLATAAIVNAAWDLMAKRAGKPLWRLLAEMTPEQLVAAVDFRYLTDALTPEDALAILRAAEPGRERRRLELERDGYPAYTTSTGWLGYDDEKIRRLCREALAAGWTSFKLKVGVDVEDDVRRARIIRDEIGPDRILAMDANQCWDVSIAIDWMARLAAFDPYWIEEPTSPDDVLGHLSIARAIAPIRVATGEHVQNRVVFKQLLQSDAISVCQLDACRLGGVNEVIAVLLLAARFEVPVCPHAGGVGLCELVQHISAFDYIAVSGRLDGRMIEYVDHLHEHFIDPVVVDRGRYRLPLEPGFSSEIQPGALGEFAFPGGRAWNDEHRRPG